MSSFERFIERIELPMLSILISDLINVLMNTISDHSLSNSKSCRNSVNSHITIRVVVWNCLASHYDVTKRCLRLVPAAFYV